MTVTCLRFATACGMSDRLRLDLVLNDFVASALATGEITVLSDGTPWRPLIDVADMARAIEWAIGRSTDHGGRVPRGQRRQQRRQLSGARAGRSRGRRTAGHQGQHQPGCPAGQAFLSGRFLAVRRTGARACAGGPADTVGPKPAVGSARNGIFGRRVSRFPADAAEDAEAPHRSRAGCRSTCAGSNR